MKNNSSITTVVRSIRLDDIIESTTVQSVVIGEWSPKGRFVETVKRKITAYSRGRFQSPISSN